MCLILTVYRPAHGTDCTNNGLSARYDQITLVHPDLPSVFQPTPESPAFHLELNPTPRLVPAKPNQRLFQSGPMFGGNFAHTTDSRFHRLITDLTGHPSYGAVPIHDRYE